MRTDIAWKKMYLTGGIMTIFGLCGIVSDVVLGFVTGGDLSALPQTAADRFLQLQADPLLGLYHLDFLNVIVQILFIPVYFSLFATLSRENLPFAGLALLIFLVGSAIFISTNTALPMYDLSIKYAAASDEMRKNLLTAAGEAMLARGGHGSPGVLIGFILPNIAGLIFSMLMYSGTLFPRSTAYTGIAGNTLLIVYLLLITSGQGESMATALAMPGGILSLVWMILISVRLFQLGQTENFPDDHGPDAP